MTIIDNILITGSKGKPMLTDIRFQPDGKPKPAIVFAHGFKGFKDWGHFNLIADYFAGAGFVFVKFNFSHNGTTPDSPLDFVDLEAFGHNSFGKELQDLNAVLNWLDDLQTPWANELNKKAIGLMGHSRGGGCVILQTANDPRVKALATWASIARYGRYFSEEQMKEWEEKGVLYIPNARTGQMMPMYFQMYEEVFANPEKFDIPAKAQSVSVPTLIVHGDNDESVPFEAALELNRFIPNSRLLRIENGNHVFGAKHPWPFETLPEDSLHICRETASFFRKTLTKQG